LFLTIEGSEIEIIINNAKVTWPYANALTLDASDSYDPDVDPDESLEFYW
jgi:hypothetical protein